VRDALAAQQRQLADQAAHQRGLAGAVGAQQRDAFAGLQPEAHVVQDLHGGSAFRRDGAMCGIRA
jgi:hypothetical protein